jgi:predicted metal-dependent hydrolase
MRTLANTLTKPISGYPFSVTLRRTARKKTVAVQVIDCEVTVLAPKFVPETEIHNFLTEKSPWIQRKLTAQINAKQQRDSGFGWLYLGRPMTLQIVEGRSGSPLFENDELIVHVPANQSEERRRVSAMHQFEWWLRSNAESLLKEFTNVHTAQIGRRPRSISFRSYKSRWGSCSIYGDITYDWRLAMAPESVMNYVAAHEVSHLEHMNHSAEFWACVKELCPDFATHRSWLREHGSSLVF